MARSLVERLRRQRVWSTEFRCWTLSEQGTLNSEQPYEDRRLALERAFADAKAAQGRHGLVTAWRILEDALSSVPEIPEE